MALTFMFFLSATAVIIGSIYWNRGMERHLLRFNQNLARAAAGLLDPEAAAGYTAEVIGRYRSAIERERINTEAYLARFRDLEQEWQMFRAKLRVLQTEFQVNSITLFVMDRERHSIITVADAAADAKDYWAPGYVDDTMTQREFDELMSNEMIITRTDNYGWIISGGAPVYDGSGEVLGFIVIDYQINDFRRNRWTFLAVFGLTMLLLNAGFCMLLYRWFHRSIAKPVVSLRRATEAYIRGKHDPNSPEEGTQYFAELDIRTEDELEVLGNVLHNMELEVTRYIGELTRVTAEKERIGAELNIAARIQADMLPRTFPPFPERTEFDIFAAMTPAKEVGGDFYDFFLVDDDHLAMVIGDVSGKGVPAALFMVIAKTLIKNHAQLGESPSEVFLT